MKEYTASITLPNAIASMVTASAPKWSTTDPDKDGLVTITGYFTTKEAAKAWEGSYSVPERLVVAIDPAPAIIGAKRINDALEAIPDLTISVPDDASEADIDATLDDLADIIADQLLDDVE